MSENDYFEPWFCSQLDILMEKCHDIEAKERATELRQYTLEYVHELEYKLKQYDELKKQIIEATLNEIKK